MKTEGEWRRVHTSMGNVDRDLEMTDNQCRRRQERERKVVDDDDDDVGQRVI